MNTSTDIDPGRGGDNYLRILSYIIFSTAVVFYIDIITPLGLTVWILYFIPLFLTLYLKWKYAPFLATGFFIVLISASFFLSPRDVSITFALLDRFFFSLMLILSALLIWNYNRKVNSLRASENRYRSLAEWSPDAIIVCIPGRILYTNQAGLNLFGVKTSGDIVGRDFIDLVDPGEQESVRGRISRAMAGAPMEIFRVRMLRSDGSSTQVEASGGHIMWNDEPAIQVILRDLTDR